MSGISRRLGRLEDGDGGRCRSCGLGPGSRIVYRLGGDLLDDPPADEPTESGPACPRCGRRRRIVIDFEDAVSPPEPLDEGGRG